MTTSIVSTDDLAIYLGQASIDEDRASLILASAQAMCESIVKPLPDGASAVVLDVAARAWTNPTNAQSQSAGPYNTSFGPVSGGLWLTRQNRATLRNLAGRSGAFTIDTTPADAGQNLPWWDAGQPSGFGDWDVPA